MTSILFLLRNFKQIFKDVLGNKSTPPWMTSWTFSRIFQNSYLKEHLRRAVFKIICENRRLKGRFFNGSNRPEM